MDIILYSNYSILRFFSTLCVTLSKVFLTSQRTQHRNTANIPAEHIQINQLKVPSSLLSLSNLTLKWHQNSETGIQTFPLTWVNAMFSLIRRLGQQSSKKGLSESSKAGNGSWSLWEDKMLLQTVPLTGERTVREFQGWSKGLYTEE